MRRGFTLVEVMLASSLSVMVFAAVTVALFSIWRLCRDTTRELDLSLKARSIREHLLFRPGVSGQESVECAGLYSAEIKEVRPKPSTDGVYAKFQKISTSTMLSDVKTEYTLAQSLADFPFFRGLIDKGTLSFTTRGKGNGDIVYVYLTVRDGQVSYYERIAMAKFSKTADGQAGVISNFPKSREEGGDSGFFDNATEEYFEEDDI